MTIDDETFDDPLGLASRRARRRTEEETAELMLATAMRMVNEGGLRVSFDLLSLEDVIAEAQVSRSAVYKRWPMKEQFYSQLMLRLAGRIHPAIGAYDSGTVLAVAETSLKNLSWFKTCAGRRRLLVELCRVGARQNFETLSQKKEWQIYMALHATLLSLPDNRFQDAMREALTRSEAEFVVKMSAFYDEMLPILGYRFRDPEGEVGPRQLAALGAAVVEGLVLTSAASPDLATREFTLDPFSTGDLVEWTHASLGFTAICLSLVETSEDLDWDSATLRVLDSKLQLIRDTAAAEMFSATSE